MTGKKYPNQGKRGPGILRDSVISKVFALLICTITGLHKRALRYQFDKRGYKLSNVNDVILYLKEIRGKQ